MQFKVLPILAIGDEGAEEELNRFLRSHRSISVHKELVHGHSGAYWSFCIEYIVSQTGSNQKAGGRRRVDYKELLSESDFAVFAQLRDARKGLADQEAIPVYAVCTNEQLAEVAKKRPASLSDLKAIEGLGDAKVEKYGESLLAVVREHGPGNSEAKDEKGGETT